MTNERILQFRIGLFVIVAGLVLVMLIVWFGESPALFRDHRYLMVHYDQAPGVSEGIPVRKNGIRIGEVSAIELDERPGEPDGVLVTLSIEDRFKLRSGSIPRLTRGLIGDVWVDMLPGTSQDLLVLSRTPEASRTQIVEGTATPDPSNALTLASEALTDVKGTLKAIETAAMGLNEITKKADKIDDFLMVFSDVSQKIGGLTDDLRSIMGNDKAELARTLRSFRDAAETMTATLDVETQASLRGTIKQLASSSARLDKILDDASPVAADLGLAPNGTPVTSLGQVIARTGRIVYNLQLLTETLHDAQGKLNTTGTVQKLLTSADVYNNINAVATGASRTMALAEKVLANFNKFAERVANDPGAIGRGALNR